MHLKIGTFNIQHGKDHRQYLKDQTDRIDLSLTSGAIRDLGLDICGLNEVRNQEQTEGLVNQAKEIASALGYEFVFAKAIPIKGGEYGNALVSRYPIVNVRTYTVAVPEEERIRKGYYETRVLLCAEVNVNGKILNVWATHFGLQECEQEKMTDLILELSASVEGPLVLMGDFNIFPDSAVYKRLASHFEDSVAVIDGDSMTFPSNAPKCKIDYLFTKGGCRAISANVPQIVVSDHLPYTAKIEWN